MAPSTYDAIARRAKVEALLDFRKVVEDINTVLYVEFTEDGAEVPVRVRDLVDREIKKVGA